MGLGVETMSKDILFKADDFVFSYRVGGIIINNGKILLQKPRNDDYAIIGGHVSSLETTMDTLKREFQEEINTDIEIERLMAVGEIFFPWGEKPCHQICLYYKVHLTDEANIPMGRLIGDGIYYLIADVVVRPEYQGQGIGSKIIDMLLSYVEEHTPSGGRASVQLIAEKGKEAFYEIKGFKLIPHEFCGSGMRKIVRK